MADKRLDRLDQDYRDAKAHVLALAHNVCLDGSEQRFLVYHLGEVEIAAIREGQHGKDIILAMLAVIVEGLSSGNWPWMQDGESILYKPEASAKKKK